MSIKQTEQEKAQEIMRLMKDSLRSPTNTAQKINERINNTQVGIADTSEEVDFQRHNLGPKDTVIENQEDNARFNPTPKPK